MGAKTKMLKQTDGGKLHSPRGQPFVGWVGVESTGGLVSNTGGAGLVGLGEWVDSFWVGLVLDWASTN